MKKRIEFQQRVKAIVSIFTFLFVNTSIASDTLASPVGNAQSGSYTVLPLQPTWRSLTPISVSQGSDRAVTAWNHLFEGYQSSSLKDEEIITWVEEARDIIKRWPGTEWAFRASLLLASMPNAHNPGIISENLQRLDFLKEALKYPGVYFSVNNEATSQHVIADVLIDLAHHGKADESYRYCLQFRWISPRIDLLAPNCQEISQHLSHTRLTSNEVVALLPAIITLHPLTQEASDTHLTTMAHQYIVNPYDKELIENLINALDAVNMKLLAERLLAELYQFDPQCLWNKKDGGVKKKLVELSTLSH